jgi:hypothetical protein
MKKIIITILLLQSIFCFSQNIEKDCESARVKYLEQNPDVAKAGMNAWSHYISYGKKEGRKWPLCSIEKEKNTSKLNLTSWKHSNGKFVQTEKLSNNNRKIWIEDDNRFSYEEFSIEGQIVILKDLDRDGVYLKLTPDVCYYKDNNNSSWLNIYSGSWSVPLKVIQSNNNQVAQAKTNTQVKTIVESSPKKEQIKYKTPPLHLSNKELRAWYDSPEGQKYLNDSGMLKELEAEMYKSASKIENNNSSNPSQKRVYICSDSDGCCKSVITSNSKPADGICNNRKHLKAGQIGHRWNEVGQQGNKQFKCNKCSIVVNTKDSPRGGGCCSVGGCSGGHTWSEIK